MLFFTLFTEYCHSVSTCCEFNECKVLFFRMYGIECMSVSHKRGIRQAFFLISGSFWVILLTGGAENRGCLHC